MKENVAEKYVRLRKEQSDIVVKIAKAWAELIELRNLHNCNIFYDSKGKEIVRVIKEKGGWVYPKVIPRKVK